MLHSWKFAADAVWEKALSIDAHRPIDMSALEKWIMESPQNVAFEAIFAENGTPSTMFGIRVTSFAKNEQVVRIKDIVSKTDLIKTEHDFQNIVADVFPELTLFSGALEAINIGIVSQWYSFGPEVVWTPQNKAPLSAEELKEKASKFFGLTQNPAAIEFWYTKPVDHWYKIYVSNRSNGGYLFDPRKYHFALDQLAKFRLHV